MPIEPAVITFSLLLITYVVLTVVVGYTIQTGGTIGAYGVEQGWTREPATSSGWMAKIKDKTGKVIGDNTPAAAMFITGNVFFAISLLVLVICHLIRGPVHGGVYAGCVIFYIIALSLFSGALYQNFSKDNNGLCQNVCSRTSL